MVRLQVALDSAEAEGLGRWPASELRDPRDQIRVVLRQELERRGLLPPLQELGRQNAEQEADDGKSS